MIIIVTAAVIAIIIVRPGVIHQILAITIPNCFIIVVVAAIPPIPNIPLF